MVFVWNCLDIAYVEILSLVMFLKTLP